MDFLNLEQSQYNRPSTRSLEFRLCSVWIIRALDNQAIAPD